MLPRRLPPPRSSVTLQGSQQVQPASSCTHWGWLRHGLRKGPPPETLTSACICQSGSACFRARPDPCLGQLARRQDRSYGTAGSWVALQWHINAGRAVVWLFLAVAWQNPGEWAALWRGTHPMPCPGQPWRAWDWGGGRGSHHCHPLACHLVPPHWSLRPHARPGDWTALLSATSR